MTRTPSDRLPRILFYAPAGEYGGAYSLLRLLEAAKGRFVPIVVCPAPTTLTKRLDELGIEYHPFEFNRYSLKRRPDWHVRMILKLRRLLVDREIDIAVVNHTGNFPLILFAAKLAGRPVVRFMRHSLAQLSGGKFSATDQRFTRYCKGLIYITNFIEAETRRELKGCPSIGMVLYNPQPIVDPKSIGDLAPLRRELQLEDASQVFGVFGRIEPSKGQDILIKAVAQLVARYPKLRLLVVGDGNHRPEFRAALEALIDEHKIRDHITFTGRRDDVAALMSVCTMMVMPSRSEALGRILLESWAVRRPVIGSDVEGIREIILQSGGGLLFPSENASELANRIALLLDDPIERERLAASGERWLAASCDPARYADRFVAFMRECLGERAAVSPAANDVSVRTSVASRS